MHQVFVYGTLKEGYCNFHINKGRRVGADFVTEQRFALYIVGPQNLPWLLPAGEGAGHPVVGQLFEVDDATLAAMDELEAVDQPGWYQRVPIAVRPLPGGEPRTAWVYLGTPARLQQEAVHAGPVPEYTQQLAAAFALAIDE